MIRSFADKDTERVFRRERVRRWHPDVQRVAQRRLAYLHRAAGLADLAAVPGHRLEALSGNRKGFYSIRVNRQWRVCFRWEDGDAWEVEITDYH